MMSKMYINKIFLKEGVNMEIFHEEAMRRTRIIKEGGRGRGRERGSERACVFPRPRL